MTSEADAWPRPTWGQIADEAIGLPGETWWEVDFRRSALADLTKKLAVGDVKSVDDGITANIDLETLAIDVIDGLDSPEDVATAWDDAHQHQDRRPDLRLRGVPVRRPQDP